MSFLTTNNYQAAIEALENMADIHEASIYVNANDTSFVVTDERFDSPEYDHIITAGSWD